MARSICFAGVLLRRERARLAIKSGVRGLNWVFHLEFSCRVVLRLLISRIFSYDRSLLNENRKYMFEKILSCSHVLLMAACRLPF